VGCGGIGEKGGGRFGDGEFSYTRKIIEEEDVGWCGNGSSIFCREHPFCAPEPISRGR
jgi:hypothetical protein